MAEYTLVRSEQNTQVVLAAEEDEWSAINRLADEVYSALVAKEDHCLVMRREGAGEDLVRVQITFNRGRHTGS